MKNVRTIAALLVLATLSSLTSCDKLRDAIKKKNTIEYMPYQAEKDGKWGMIGLNGKVLFAEEFKNMPTLPVNERFMVLNKDSLWEYYTLEEKPRKIGDEYVEGTSFANNGLAVVVRQGRHIEAINKEGKVMLKLDHIDGKPVLRVSAFSDKGIAWFTTQDGLSGCIDSEGQVIIKPKYRRIAFSYTNHNYFLAVEDRHAAGLLSAPASVKRQILDLQGHVVKELPADKFIDVSAEQDGYFVAQVIEGSDTIMGILNPQGEWVVKPSKSTKNIVDIKFGHFIYYDGDAYGVKDLQGNIKVRAKYDNIMFTENSSRLIAVTDEKRKLIDFDDNQIGNDTWLACWAFLNDYTLAKVSQNSFTSIDADGNEQKDVPEIFNADHSGYAIFVRSQYVDISALVKKMKIEADAIMGFSFDATAADIHRVAYELNDSLSFAFRLPATADGYTSTTVTNIEVPLLIENTSLLLRAYFSNNILQTSNSTKKFRAEKPIQLAIMANLKGEPLQYKEHEFYEAIRKHVEQFGEVVASNDNAVVVKTRAHCMAAYDYKQGNLVGCYMLPLNYIEYMKESIKDLE